MQQDIKYLKTTVVIGDIGVGRKSIQLATDSSRQFVTGFALVGTGDFSGYTISLGSPEKTFVNDIPAVLVQKETFKFMSRSECFLPVKANANGRILYLYIDKKEGAGTITKFDVILRVSNIESPKEYILQYETIEHPAVSVEKLITLSDRGRKVIGINVNHSSNPDFELVDNDGVLLNRISSEMLEFSKESPVLSGFFPLEVANSGSKQVTAKIYSRVSPNPAGTIDVIFLLEP